MGQASDTPLDPARRRELMAAGQVAFNRREFYEAHEYWEEVWDVIDDPERRWTQGLIQLATGLHKLAHGRPDVCETLLRKALGKLETAPASFEAIDVEGARHAAGLLLVRLAGEGPLPKASNFPII
jgi:predicted metal-dependent hydrolase